MYGTCGRIDNKADFDFDFESHAGIMRAVCLTVSTQHGCSLGGQDVWKSLVLVEPSPIMIS